MKKLLTIVCALCLVMAFSMPAGAVDDIEDNQAAIALLGQTNQAQDDATVDNDGLDVDTGDIASGNSQDNDGTDVDVTTGDLLSNNDDHSDDDGTDVDVTTGDLLSNNDSNDDNSTNLCLDDNSDDDLVDNKGGAMDNDLIDQDGDQDGIDTDIQDNETNIASKNSLDDNSDDDGTDVDVQDNNVELLSRNNLDDNSDDDLVDNKNGNMDNDLVDQDGDQDVIDQDNTDNDLVDQDNTDNDLVDNDSHDNDNDLADNDMNDNVAAAAMGGFAIGVSIDDIELNLASTTSIAGIYQESKYDSKAEAGFFLGDDADARSKFESECHSVDASVYSNTGITGANFTAGNFNNSANLNNVTMTVQW